jgi:hypothetical protein
MEDYGIAGLVRTALYLDTVVGLEVLSIGRAALERSECSMEVVGTHLLVRLELRGTWVWLSACGLDEGRARADLQFRRRTDGMDRGAPLCAGP